MKENNNSNMLADGLVIFLIVPNITLQLLCKYVVRYYFLYSIIIRFSKDIVIEYFIDYKINIVNNL